MNSEQAINLTTKITVWSSAAVIVAAAILSFTALHDLFIAIGLFHWTLAWLFPLLFDLAEVSAAVSVLNAKLQGDDDKFAWRLVLVFTSLGVLANVFHAYQAFYTGHIDGLQFWLAVFATSLFPLSIALVTHLVKRVIERHIRRSEAVCTISDLQSTQSSLTAVINAKRLEIASLHAEIAQLKTVKVKHEPDDPVKARRREIVRVLNDEGDIGATEFAKRLRVSRNTVYSDLGELAEQRLIHKNGNGWEAT